MPADPDLAYLSTSATIIEQGMAGVSAALIEGSQCVLPRSRRGARRTALQQAMVARDRLDALIAELDDGERR